MIVLASISWFCKSGIPTTFYVVREQANLPSRKCKGETIREFIKLMNNVPNTCLCVCDVSHHTPKAYNYAKDKRLRNAGVVFRDDKSKKHAAKLHKFFRKNPFEHGLVHGASTMSNVLHLVAFLGYLRILFVGVDLRDSRYFWLGPKENRHTLIRKGRSYSQKHPVTQDVLRLVTRYKKHMGAELYVANKKSLLTRRIPYKRISEFG